MSEAVVTWRDWTEERVKRAEASTAAVETRLMGIMAERDRQVTTAFLSSEKAVAKAEDAQRHVNEGQNEFRGALKDQNATFATKEMVERQRSDIDELKAWRASMGGKEKGGEHLQKILMLVAGAVISWVALKLGAAP